MKTFSSLRAVAVALIAVAAIAAAAGSSDATTTLRHTRLVKSIPGKDSTVTASPKSLQLWFSEKVDLSLTSVKLASAAGANVEMAKPTRDGGAEAPVVLTLGGTLTDGAYTVNWTVAGADGHPVKGTFGFTVKSAR